MKKLLKQIFAYLIATYLIYLTFSFRFLYIDKLIFKYLFLLFGEVWVFIPIFFTLSLFLNAKRMLFSLLIALSCIKTLHDANNISVLPDVFQYFRSFLLVYVFPLILFLFSSVMLYLKSRVKKSKKTLSILIIISQLLIIGLNLSLHFQSAGFDSEINKIISLGFHGSGGIIGSFISSSFFGLFRGYLIYIFMVLALFPIYVIALGLYRLMPDIWVLPNITLPTKTPIFKKAALAAVPKEKDKKEKDIKPTNENILDGIFKVKETDLASIEKMNKSVKHKIEALEDLLKEYGIGAKVVHTVIGPSVTRFEVSVAKGVRVKKVTALSDDIAMNLEAYSVRIEAPIPGKNAIGVEIPNEVKADVCFGSIIKKKQPKNHLQVVLGKNIVGEDVLVDLKKMPHLLVAGRTGAGKSVGINCIIASILYTATPEDVKFIMIDPKMVELMPYNGIPHLYVPVITDPKLAANALSWAVQEMENRYRILAEGGFRHIDSYNLKEDVKIPYLVIIIDELADLMMVAPATIETSIARIAQKARAVGIHLVIATQRPSVDVITGTIKANLPSRISYSVTSQIDSRTILDQQGAEKLLGKGDLLFLESGKSGLVRIQGAYVSDDEVTEFAEYLRSKGKPQYNEEILEEVEIIERDSLYDKAKELVVDEQNASTSFIQRKLKIGYSRAARIIDQLEEDGVVRIGPNGEKEILEDV